MLKIKDCEYCKAYPKNKVQIHGKIIKTKDLKLTVGYKNREILLSDYLQLFILKGIADKKAGLMIATLDGVRYIDINYCPFCGRYLS